jgi:hypothetical protein
MRKPPDVPILCDGLRTIAYWARELRAHRCSACGRIVKVVW